MNSASRIINSILFPKNITRKEIGKRLTPDEIAHYEKEHAYYAEMEKCLAELPKRIRLDSIIIRKKLTDIMVDNGFRESKSKEALRYLASDPDALGNFLYSGRWFDPPQSLRSFRMMGSIPLIPLCEARLNILVFRRAVEAIVKALTRADFPIDLDHSRRKAVIDKILWFGVSRLQEHYKEIEQNPILVWRAYSLSRLAGWQTPSWILDYFDNCASKMDIALSTPKAKSDVKVLGLFGFGKSDGKGKAVTRSYTLEKRDATFAILYNNVDIYGGWSRETTKTATDVSGLKEDTLKAVYKDTLQLLGLPEKLPAKAGRRPKPP